MNREGGKDEELRDQREEIARQLLIKRNIPEDLDVDEVFSIMEQKNVDMFEAIEIIKRRRRRVKVFRLRKRNYG
jgi:hypothetical protein